MGKGTREDEAGMLENYSNSFLRLGVGLPEWRSGKESPANGDHERGGFDPQFPGGSPWSRAVPLVFLPGNPCGQRSLWAAVLGLLKRMQTWLSTHTFSGEFGGIIIANIKPTRVTEHLHRTNTDEKTRMPILYSWLINKNIFYIFKTNISYFISFSSFQNNLIALHLWSQWHIPVKSQRNQNSVVVLRHLSWSMGLFLECCTLSMWTLVVLL